MVEFSVTSFLEFVGMLGAISGAVFMSRDPRIVKNNMLKAFSSFVIANLAMLIVAIINEMSALVIQQLLFLSGAVIGFRVNLYKTKVNIKVLNKIMYSLYVILFLYMLNVIYLSLNLNFSNINLPVIESLAAFMAILGNFLLSGTYSSQLKAFILFIIADIVYIWIAIDHNMYFFMLQSAFTVYTAYSGYINVSRLLNQTTSRA